MYTQEKTQSGTIVDSLLQSFLFDPLDPHFVWVHCNQIREFKCLPEQLPEACLLPPVVNACHFHRTSGSCIIEAFTCRYHQWPQVLLVDLKFDGWRRLAV